MHLVHPSNPPVSFARRSRWRVLALTALLAAGGCNNARYSLRHDECVPGIQRVGVLVSSKVYSLHTGGQLEERPDLEPQVTERTALTIESEVRRCGRKAVSLTPTSVATQPDDNSPIAERALLSAVSEGILTHHYLFGKQRVIDYVTGDAAKDLADDVDALLCVEVTGKVPTAGRQALQVTAMAVGFVTGIHVPVPTKETRVCLMLVEPKTGEVLWFNMVGKAARVDQDSAFRSLCKDASKYLLKPCK